MIRIIIFLVTFSFFLNPCSAQQKLIKNEPLFVLRPYIFINYNLYHRYQKPSFNNEQSVGQVFNVLPGLGGGLIMGKKTVLMFSVEGALSYCPFSLDIEGFEGMGALSFPLLANFRIPVEGFFFFQFGGGVQFNQINIHQSVNPSAVNPFFMTYIGELSVGVEENLFLLYFLRFGYNGQSASTFDFGIRLGLNGSLWE